MKFIWSGSGAMTALFIFLGALVGFFSVDAAGLTLAVLIAVLVSAIPNQIMASRLEAKSRESIDPETGETVTGDRSSLLFIPVTYWTHVILLVGVIVEAFLLLGRFGD
ncbi:MAG: hypothetical protein P8X50_00905 [Maritimibacter sp.]